MLDDIWKKKKKLKLIYCKHKITWQFGIQTEIIQLHSLVLYINRNGYFEDTSICLVVFLVVVFLDWYLTFYNYSHIQILSVFFIDSYYWSICLTYFKYIYNDFSLILDITDQIWLYFDGN